MDVKSISCSFTDTNAISNGHSIYIDRSTSDHISIDSCKCIDCGFNSKTYSIVLDISKLDFTNNEIIFTDSEKSCGCIELVQIGEHVFDGNLFKNAYNDNSIWNSAGINAAIRNDLTSLIIKNNVFDQMRGNTQGRCFCIVNKGENNQNIQVKNNTVQNCPPGRALLKIWSQTKIENFKIDSCKFDNNSVTDCFESIGPTSHFWFENTFSGDNIEPFDLTIESCSFEANVNQNKGGGLSYGKTKYTANIKLILNRCNFSDNYAKEGGGELNLQTYQGCEINYCEFKKNKSDDGSGSIYIETDFECKKKKKKKKK